MIYEFDRFRDGRKMAEGVRISKAASFEEALATAKSWYPPGDTFELKPQADTEVKRD